MRTLSQKFLENIADVLDLVNGDRDIKYNPAVIFLNSIFLTIFFSFTTNIVMEIISILTAYLLAVIMKVSLQRLLRTSMLIILFTLVIGLPIILLENGEKVIVSFLLFKITFSLNGFYTVMNLMLRTLSAALILLVFLSYLGWRNIVIALYELRIPKKFIIMIALMIKFLPIYARLTARRLFARESRLVVSGLRKKWYILSTVLTDLIILSENFSYRLALGLRSRNFTISTTEFITSNKIGIRDISTLIATLTFLAILSWL